MRCGISVPASAVSKASSAGGTLIAVGGFWVEYISDKRWGTSKASNSTGIQGFKGFDCGFGADGNGRGSAERLAKEKGLFTERIGSWTWASDSDIINRLSNAGTVTLRPGGDGSVRISDTDWGI